MSTGGGLCVYEARVTLRVYQVTCKYVLGHDYGMWAEVTLGMCVCELLKVCEEAGLSGSVVQRSRHSTAAIWVCN